MFTGVDHDVDIFGSGVVAEEDEADFTAGARACEDEKGGACMQGGKGVPWLRKVRQASLLCTSARPCMGRRVHGQKSAWVAETWSRLTSLA